MAINIEQFMLDIYTPMIDYCEADQLLLANQKVPDDQLKDNRIIYNMIVTGNTGGRHTVIQKEDVVPHEGEDWEWDIGHHNIFFPEATLSITGFNNTVMELAKLRDWFYINGLGDAWLKDENIDCVIRQVMEINDRTIYLESDYEKRHGFDVILEFKDIVTVTEDTIEVVEITGDIEKTIDI